MVTTPSAVTSQLKKYSEDQAVSLYYNSKSDFSLDEAGAKKYKKKATAPGNYVTDLQNDLRTIGYLTEDADGYFGSKTKRAVVRFQRHAARLYRMKSLEKKKPIADDIKTQTFTNVSDGTVNIATAKEIKSWISKHWVLPLGRFKLTAINGGKLRSDVALAWASAALKIKSLGGTIDPSPSYGDTIRPITVNSRTGGNSLYSLHYTGRAIDLTQALADRNKHQRYYLVKENKGSDVVFRIYCKTLQQKGQEGKKIKATTKYYDVSSKKLRDFPEAYYLDVTAILVNAGFSRIPAHSNWESLIWKKAEWWHYYWSKNIQETFQDEMELVGYSEKQLRKEYWNTNARLDKKPG